MHLQHFNSWSENLVLHKLKALNVSFNTYFQKQKACDTSVVPRRMVSRTRTAFKQFAEHFILCRYNINSLSGNMSDTAKNAQPVLAWWKQHWTMLCCPHCSRLSTILFNIVTPDCRLIQAHRLVQYCWQPWTMWAAQHCSMLFSSSQNRLCVFCCVAEALFLNGLTGLTVNSSS